MSRFPLPVLWLWAGSVLAQLLVMALLFLKGSSRKLPYFTAYVGLNICQAGFLVFVYSHLWSQPATADTLAWTSEFPTLVAQALATVEILEITLRPYQGIWGAWMARFDRHLGDRRPSRRTGSSRPLGFGSVVPARSRLSSHFCFGADCLSAACSLLLYSSPARLQNDARRILFLFLHGNCGQYPSSSLFPQRFLPPRCCVAAFDYVFLCYCPSRLGDCPP